MFGPPVEETGSIAIGSRAVIDLNTPATADAKATNMRSLYDLTAHAPTSRGTSGQLGRMRQGESLGRLGRSICFAGGPEHCEDDGHGDGGRISRRRCIPQMAVGATAKLWIDAEDGALAVRIDVTQGGQTKTISEVGRSLRWWRAGCGVCTACNLHRARGTASAHAAGEGYCGGDYNSSGRRLYRRGDDGGHGSGGGVRSVQVRVMQAGSMRPIPSGPQALGHRD